MAKSNPAFRGLYTHDEANKPSNSPGLKSNPKYRGIYAYDVDRKPDGNPATPPAPPEQS